MAGWRVGGILRSEGEGPEVAEKGADLRGGSPETEGARGFYSEGAGRAGLGVGWVAGQTKMGEGRGAAEVGSRSCWGAVQLGASAAAETDPHLQ